MRSLGEERTLLQLTRQAPALTQWRDVFRATLSVALHVLVHCAARNQSSLVSRDNSTWQDDKTDACYCAFGHVACAMGWFERKCTPDHRIPFSRSIPCHRSLRGIKQIITANLKGDVNKCTQVTYQADRIKRPAAPATCIEPRLR